MCLISPRRALSISASHPGLFRFALPRGRAVIDKDILTVNGKAELFAVVQREALLPVDRDFLLVALHGLTRVDGRKLWIGDGFHRERPSGGLDRPLRCIVPGHDQDATNCACRTSRS